MSQGAIIGGGLLFLLVIIGLVVYFTMMGGEETTEPEQAPAAVVKIATPSSPPKYQKYPDHDFTGGDISCEAGVEAAACEAKCDANDKCISYIHTANDKLCCIKHGTPSYKELPGRQITGYIKNIDGYEVKQVGDRVAGDIENMNPGTLPTCKARCDELDNCIGFNFNNNNCWIKKADGIAQTYSNNGYQFYTKK
jgi:hypothetical protein